MVAMLYLEIIFIGVSLSMDAFSLAITLSMSGMIKYKAIYYSLFVGMFHFIMPCLGYSFKNIVDRVLIIPPNYIFIGVIVFIIIGIILDNDKKITNKILKPIIFAFIVSIDSFSFGIIISKSKLVLSCTVFSLLSSLFTLLGFKIGKIIGNNFQKYTKIISITLLLIVLIFKLI
ncbi:MAG: manganese efflux pump [Bacilli bacterium]|nr:manganese efflux pump [Bacilli bacterium]